MNRYFPNVVLAAALMIGGCSIADTGNNTAAPVPPTEQVPNDSIADVTSIDEQLMFAAEAFYNVPAHAYVVTDGRNQLTPETKAKLKPILTDLYGYLLVTRNAYNVGNAATFTASYKAMEKLSLSAKNILGLK